MRGVQAAGLLVVGLAIAMAGAAEVRAASIYEYEGNTFGTVTPTGSSIFTTADFVSITLLFASELGSNLDFVDRAGAVQLATFSAGTKSFDYDAGETIPTAQISELRLSTDREGNIVEWRLVAETMPAPAAVGEDRIRIESSDSPEVDSATFSICVRGSGSRCIFENDRGLSQGQHGTWTLVPEPGTAGMVALGLLLIGARRSRSH